MERNPHMRRLLDWIYRLASILAAAALAGLLIVLALQILMRELGSMVVWADDMASFLLVGTSFLALTGTFRNGVHVRVSLLLNRVGPRAGRVIEIACLTLTSLLTAYLAYASVDQAYDSFRFDERTSGLVAFKVWMPQAVMALGVAIFLIAVVDALVCVLRGERPVYAEHPSAEGIATGEDAPGADAEKEARRYAAAE